ncbi:TetR/AcrR family transcriptional regulator [Tahibacter amnicola]|uniref:TetR/AcrR family transcriptional regulator n=1 Tax=Tahibacter amnicola TaxID=2976241 RepID=A0ABY6BMI3_9GAMM|nr:TetR/AcrR family transcriptional regulator [Tahibacter amnicola]
MSSVLKQPAPGRPKDLEKRAAILDAGKRLFPRQGFEGTSMDAIAAEAGVSKLTVYSHFTDKETLFREVIQAKCEEQLPLSLFLADLDGPIRGQLMTIARAFFTLITSEDAISLHRMMTAQTQQSMKLAQMFWEAGPKRLQDSFEMFLRAEIAAGQLDIPDPRRATGQFFCLLKGELHARMMFGCCDPISDLDVGAHLEATVDLFLRAYSPR